MSWKDIQHKIQSLSQAHEQVKNWKEGGDQIIWTNGCFDLLHLGHLKYLSEAKALGDRLVVGLNSDHSVQILKGAQRPILDQETRAAKLAALAMVDLVVPFDHPTPIQEIVTLQPSVITKGGDYQASDVVGGAEAAEWGGRVVIIPFEAGHSTSAIIRKIKKLP